MPLSQQHVELHPNCPPWPIGLDGGELPLLYGIAITGVSLMGMEGGKLRHLAFHTVAPTRTAMPRHLYGLGPRL